MPLYQATDYILFDEPCYGLYELNYKSPDQHTRRRYQIIIVMRNDKPAEYRKDMGSVKKFKGLDQFRIPGGVQNETTGRFDIVHTVGELMDIADYLRVKRPFDKKAFLKLDKINE